MGDSWIVLVAPEAAYLASFRFYMISEPSFRCLSVKCLICLLDLWLTAGMLGKSKLAKVPSCFVLSTSLL